MTPDGTKVLGLHPRQSNARRTLSKLGVTNDPARRVGQHRSGRRSVYAALPHFRLVLAEPYQDVRSAIAREKQLKKWRRVWKIDLIEGTNPDREDLYARFNA